MQGRYLTQGAKSLLVTTLVLLSRHVSWSAQVPPPVDKETIFRAWNDRPQKLSSLRISWVEQEFIKKGVDSSPADTNAVPPEDVSREFRRSVSLDGMNRMRYEADGAFRAYHEPGDLSQQHYLSVFDSNACKIFWPKPKNRKSGIGYITDKNRNEAVTKLSMKPLLWAFRPMVPSYGNINTINCRIAGKQGMIDERPCIILEEPLEGSQKAIRQYWVDPGMDFAIRRFVSLKRNRVSITMDIDYVPDAASAWIPSGWKYTWAKEDGTLARSGSARVTSSVVNPLINPAEFQFEYPPGTIVTDMRSKEDFLVKEDGSRRVITQEEQDVPYERLLNTESGLAHGRPANSRWALVAVFNLLLLTGCAIAVLMQRRRARPSATG